MIEDRCDGMRATGMPGCMPQSDHEDVAAEPKSATGQYLKPLLERASVQPVKAAAPVKKKRRKRSADEAEDDDQSGGLIKRMKPDLIAAK